MIENSEPCFFKNGVPDDFVDHGADLAVFSNFDEAYHCFLFDLISLAMKSFQLIVTENEYIGKLYVSGGFSRNKKFMAILQQLMPKANIEASEIDNASALGAALVLKNVI